MKNVSQTSYYSYNFRIFSFQLKDIHKNNYSSIPDYFLSNLTTKRPSKKEKKNWGVSCPQRERERERERGIKKNILIDLPVELDTIAYKIMFSR